MIGNLRNMAIDMGSELENQNRQLERINLKVKTSGLVNLQAHISVNKLRVITLNICFKHYLLKYISEVHFRTLRCLVVYESKPFYAAVTKVIGLEQCH